MCYLDKCLLCIPVEKGCFVCAIIIAIGTGLTMVISFILGSLGAAAVIAPHCSSNYDYDRNFSYSCTANSGLTVGMYMLALSSAIGFAFAVVLCNGISKRRAGYVKIYFVYGVVVIALSLLSGMVLLPLFYYPISMFLFILCVPYSLFVVLVQHTYFKLAEGGNGAVLKTQDLMEI